ncbi:hypothetical protein EVAR_83226_1 [Eumeta japonica]|uniref:Uncharacterized protein n=1 Tax=Eumeta variegata TaxID=151549 RepID=A0A4C1Y202_EUMVA|nr:hypothetical protein EVAR_83226_1 [Eumeta japonica]
MKMFTDVNDPVINMTGKNFNIERQRNTRRMANSAFKVNTTCLMVTLLKAARVICPSSSSRERSAARRWRAGESDGCCHHGSVMTFTKSTYNKNGHAICGLGQWAAPGLRPRRAAFTRALPSAMYIIL